jgi:ComF family protein
MNLIKRLFDIIFPPRKTEEAVQECAASVSRLFPYIQYRDILYKNIQYTAILPYTNELVRSCITEAKFHGNEKAMELVAEIFGKYIDEEIPIPFTIVPIMLSKRRLKDRGYNQVERIISKLPPRILKKISVQKEILIRVRDTLPQSTLQKDARLENMKGAFSTKMMLDPFTHYVLVDDVATTGATLHSAYEALIQAGAKKVSCLAFAH